MGRQPVRGRRLLADQAAARRGCRYSCRYSRPVGLRRSLLPAAMALAVLAVGCAQSGARRLPVSTGDCVLLRTIDNWEALDSYRLVINRGSSTNAYEIEFERRCPSLRYASEIRFASPDEEICDYRNDAVLVEQDRCGIGTIRRFYENRYGENAWEREAGTDFLRQGN